MIVLIFMIFLSHFICAQPFYSDQEAGSVESVLPAVLAISALHPKMLDADSLFLSSEANEFTVGSVQCHAIHVPALQNSAIFIMGNDPISLEWFNIHHEDLQNIHAVGVVASVFSKEALDVLREKIDLPLITVNLSGFSALIGTNHYPVLLYKNWVLQ